MSFSKRLLVLISCTLAVLIPVQLVSAQPVTEAPQLASSVVPSHVSVRALKIGDDSLEVAALQQALTDAGWPTWVDGDFGPHTQKTLLMYQRANGLVIDGIAGPQTLGSLKLTYVATVPTAPIRGEAVQVTTPETPTGLNGLPFAPPGLNACDEMNFYRIQAALPDRFGSSGQHQTWVQSDGLGWREAKCNNDLISSTGCCVGYWQMYFSQHMSDHRMIPRYAACGITQVSDYFGNAPLQKQKQACATKALYDVAGLSPWAPY